MSQGSHSGERRANHLQGQTSPYLLQHLYNPVDWYPWGEEALERARREDRPILLSIGYAACHWCHVMERESFENDEIAGLLNDGFVPIKVDREERPDLDEIYMNAVQLLTGAGGWPLNMFLMPDLRPFAGGTYFPPEDRWGRIGLAELLRRVRSAWTDRREEIDRTAGELTGRIRQIAAGLTEPAHGGAIGVESSARAAVELSQRYDPEWGGFGSAPKFPPDGGVALLFREHARTGERVPLDMALYTLERMARGGLYDQLGGGFARYSVDEMWLVPHFEKMLYTQALLVPLYVDAFRLTGLPLYRRVVERTLDFVRRELTGDHGGFLSSLDADSEGEEGLYYVWTREELDALLGGADAEWISGVYGVTAEGNFEGRNILHLIAHSAAEHAAGLGIDEAGLFQRLAPLERRLLEAREERIRPGTDDKVLTAWNGLMLTALARAYQRFGREADLQAAVAAAEFLLREMWDGRRLSVSYREGRAGLNGYLDDHAFLARGLLDLYESAFERRHLEAATAVAERMLEGFEDGERGGFFFTSNDHETLLTRSRSRHDGALPAGAGVATEVLLRLALHLDRDDFRRAAVRALEDGSGAVARMPSGFASLLAGAELARGRTVEVAVIGEAADPSTAALLAAARRPHLPGLIVAAAPPGESAEQHPLLAGKQPLEGRPTAWVCRDYACRQPTTDPEELERQLIEAATAGDR